MLSWLRSIKTNPVEDYTVYFIHERSWTIERMSKFKEKVLNDISSSMYLTGVCTVRALVCMD